MLSFSAAQSVLRWKDHVDGTLSFSAPTLNATSFCSLAAFFGPLQIRWVLFAFLETFLHQLPTAHIHKNHELLATYCNGN